MVKEASVKKTPGYVQFDTYQLKAKKFLAKNKVQYLDGMSFDRYKDSNGLNYLSEDKLLIMCGNHHHLAYWFKTGQCKLLYTGPSVNKNLYIPVKRDWIDFDHLAKIGKSGCVFEQPLDDEKEIYFCNESIIPKVQFRHRTPS